MDQQQNSTPSKLSTSISTETDVNAGKSLDMLAYEIAEAIAIGDRRTHSVAALLMAFAREVKRQAVEL
jgi:hypothetical protein